MRILVAELVRLHRFEFQIHSLVSILLVVELGATLRKVDDQTRRSRLGRDDASALKLAEIDGEGKFTHC